jgi:hypothetical protein
MMTVLGVNVANPITRAPLQAMSHVGQAVPLLHMTAVVVANEDRVTDTHLQIEVEKEDAVKQFSS